MPKVKGLVIPENPPLNTEGLEDEHDDEVEEQISAEGFAAAADDLSVLDFFAGCVAIGLATRGDGGPAGFGKYAYDIAKELVEERARREDAGE